ncbi:MAG: hypothetical protein HeimC3_53340 [Candidatus Heimdallarchaeota archaeon LC_3]|nr:MAG: hypothetical protein HeimC3_53340 [Candidatus Heimdallarchaeota archaeon LC_3]
MSYSADQMVIFLLWVGHDVRNEIGINQKYIGETVETVKNINDYWRIFFTTFKAVSIYSFISFSVTVFVSFDTI